MTKEEDEARSVALTNKEDEDQHMLVATMLDKVRSMAVAEEEDKVWHVIMVTVTGKGGGQGPSRHHGNKGNRARHVIMAKEEDKARSAAMSKRGGRGPVHNRGQE